MRISVFERITDSTPIRREMSWPEFARELGTHDFSFADKNDVPAFSPAEYPEGALRSKTAVQRVHFGVLDLDKLTDAQLEGLTPHLKGIEHIFYTTWSHAKRAPLWCGRLLVPFSRPVLQSEWGVFWPRFNHRFGGIADIQCKDQSRLYFIPAAPEGTEDSAFLIHEPGEPVDVDAILAAPVPAREQLATQAEMVGREEIEALAQRLRRRASPNSKRLGNRLSHVLAGDVFAEDGERDTIIFQLTGVLVEAYPHGDAGALAQLFAASIEKMSANSYTCPTVEEVEAKIRRHQEQLLEERAELEQEVLKEKARAIRQAFANGREHPYTEEELNRFAEESGTTRDAFIKRWVIQKGKSFYLFFDGTYLPPYTDSDVIAGALRDLAPASSDNVGLWKIDSRNQLTTKSPGELVRDYGTVATAVVADLTAKQASFDDRTRTLFEAPCPLRDLEPEFDADVDEWLKWFSGHHYETLCDWLAVLTKLDEPCAALYLDGSPGAGKTLLADGLARLWSEDKPTDLEQAMASFNDALTKCPLVLADETIPRDARGRVRTAELRQFIQARNRPLRRKYQPDAVLRGSIRLIITANNKELLVSNESLTSNDIQAIVDRLIYIYCPPNSARFLQSLGMDTMRSFVAEDKIAKHALWLRDNREVKRGHRFLVEGADSSLHRTLTTSSGMRSAVCNWLVAYLLNPQPADTTAGMLVRVHGNKVLVTARAISQWWALYPTNEPAPPTGRVSMALSGLSNDKKQLTAADGRRTNYWVVDEHNLIEWAERNGYATEESLLEALQKEDRTL